MVNTAVRPLGPRTIDGFADPIELVQLTSRDGHPLPG
jgi:hypothetical protein